MKRGWLAVLGALGALALVAPARAERGSREDPYPVPTTDGEIVVDGRLDEPAWGEALAVAVDTETGPAENAPAPVDTECLIIHDERFLYVAFRAEDPDPAAIRAHLSDRDDAFSDDFVGIVLDPFDDERRAFEFFANPLGVQMDLFLDDVGGSEDAAWDAIWASAGRITETGYVVEMAIPFHQLRFGAGEGTQVWGFDALRFYPRGDRHRLSIHALDRDVDCYLCQASKMVGFAGISPGRNLEMAPTLTANRVDRRDDFPDDPLEQGDVDTEVGLSVKWGLTSNLIVNGALNPDFSQVEADAAQLDVNRRFALFFPEKRPFFLEGADFFDTPLEAVFTRNVADPTWGLKLTGKVGASALGVFAARDEVTNLIFPGSQSSDATSLALQSTDAVVRYRYDLGASSALGVLATSRDGGDYSNRVAGVDGLWRFTDSDRVSFQWLRSRTEYPLDVAEEFDQPAGVLEDDASWLEYRHESRNWNGRLLYRDRGDEFRADMGFVPQVDTRLLLAGLERVWWGGEEDRWNRIEVGGDWDRTEDRDGQLLEQESEAWGEISGPLQSFLFASVGTRERFFEGVTFDETFSRLYVEAQPTGDLFVGLFAAAGDEIDFANVRPAEELLLEPSVRYNFGKHLRLRWNHTFQRLDVDGGELFTANLSQMRLVYQFSVRSFLRLITQYTQIDRDPALFEDEVEAETERLFNQLLFSYKLNPQTVLFVGYSDDQRGSEVVDLTREGRTFFFKVGYAWVP